MPSSTTILGLPYPLGTDPVRDGDNDIKALAEGVDLDMGLVKRLPSGVTGTGISADARGNITLTAVSGAVFINGIFTSTWQNYRILMTGVNSTNNLINLRMATGGASPAPADNNYYISDVYNTHTTGPARYYAGPLTEAVLVCGDVHYAMTIDVFRPAEVQRTGFVVAYHQWSATGAQTGHRHMLHNSSTAYDGLRLIPSAGSITGTIRVYAYGQ